MNFNCPVYDLRNNKDSPYFKNMQIGTEKVFGAENNYCTCKKKEVVVNVEEECKDKFPICFEATCTNPRCQNIVMVYSNKKTGSMTLYSSLAVYFSNNTSIFHFHNNSDLLFFNIETVQVCDLCLHLSNKGKNVTIIEIYRPILELCISNFFFAIDLYCRQINENETMTDYLNYVINIFNNLFFYLIEANNENKIAADHNFQIKDHRVNPFVFAQKVNNLTYVLIKLKDSNIWQELLKDYLPEGNFQIHRENETENKCQGELYKLFKNNYRLPKNYFEIIKENKQFIDFYTEDERAEYLKDWQTKLDSRDHLSFTKEETETHLLNILEANKINMKNFRAKTGNHNRSTESNCVCDECVNEREATILFYNLLNSNVIQVALETNIFT